MRRALLISLVLVACKPAVLPAIDAGPIDTDAGAVKRPIYAHAHNDYEHTRPLFDALDQKFQSVEADIWWSGSDLGVSHSGAPYKGTLRELYLAPLEQYVEANHGSVYGDGQPFFLWVDLKQGSTALQDSLVSQLGEFSSMLTSFDDAGEVTLGAVTVVLTGDSAKTALCNRAAPRLYTRDGDYAATDAVGDGHWGYYGVNYFSVMQWDGEAPIPPTQRAQLQNLVDGAHAKHRLLRVFGTPEGALYWQAAIDTGNDFINTDDLPGLRAFLNARP